MTRKKIQPPPAAAIIYARVSTATQAEEGTSLETQVSACEQYAAARGYAEVEVVRETFSGAELWDRPELSRVRERVRRHEVGALVCHSLDRLSRNPVHLALISEECERFGVKLGCVTEEIDNSPTGQLVNYVRGYAAQLEREKIRERSMRGKLAKARSGKIVGLGRDLYGYTLDRETWTRRVNEREAEVVRRIFEALAAGESANRVAHALDREGVPMPSHGKRGRQGTKGWTSAAVTDMIRDPRYKGVEIANRFRHERKGRRSKITPRDASEHIVLPDGTTPAVVAAGVWERANAQLNCVLSAR
jgi:site-specific DNA recombinase